MKKLIAFTLPLALTISALADEAKILEIAEKTAIRDTLRNDLEQIQRERDRCERTRRNWQTATVIGAVGAAAAVTTVWTQQSRLNRVRTQAAQNQAAQNQPAGQ
jgi:adenylylsulfate kinase-like enzyme